MSDRNWAEYLYETSMMRDLVGYAGPGSILIVGLLIELEMAQILKSLISHWTGFVLLVVASYIAATGLRILGTVLPIVMFHRSWGLFGRAGDLYIDDNWKRKIERCLWRQNESSLKELYNKTYKNNHEHEAFINRENVFMHLTGLSGMAFLALAGAVFFLDKNGLANFLCVSECNIMLVLILVAILFLLGHYRHTHQIQVALRPNRSS